MSAPSSSVLGGGSSGKSSSGGGVSALKRLMTEYKGKTKVGAEHYVANGYVTLGRFVLERPGWNQCGTRQRGQLFRLGSPHRVGILGRGTIVLILVPLQRTAGYTLRGRSISGHHHIPPRLSPESSKYALYM